MNMKRMRGRNHRGGGGGGPIRHQSGNMPLNRNHVFDSNGPDVRVRGTSQQLFEKYLQLGRDATSGGDRVMAESYFQHAEHYFRILTAMNQAAAQQQANHQQQQQHGRRPEQQAEPPLAEEAVEEQPPGLGEQPGAETRDIPISAAPPQSGS